MTRTANKYSVLNTLPENDDQELRILKDRIIVDQYLNKNLQPTPSKAANWTHDMRKYHKEKSTGVIDIEINNNKSAEFTKDVVSVEGGIAESIKMNEVIGVDGQVINDE